MFIGTKNLYFKLNSPHTGKRTPSSVDDVEELLPLTESDFEVTSETESSGKDACVNGDIRNGKMSVKPLPMKIDELSTKDIKCGYGPYSPNCMQKFNNPKALLFFLSCFCMLQGKNRILRCKVKIVAKVINMLLKKETISMFESVFVCCETRNCFCMLL